MAELTTRRRRHVRIDLRHPRTQRPRHARRGRPGRARRAVLSGLGLLAWLLVASWVGSQLPFETTAVLVLTLGLVHGVLSAWAPAWYAGRRAAWQSFFGSRGTALVSVVLCGLVLASGVYREARVHAARRACEHALQTHRLPEWKTVYEERMPIGMTDFFTGGGMTCLALVDYAP